MLLLKQPTLCVGKKRVARVPQFQLLCAEGKQRPQVAQWHRNKRGNLASRGADQSLEWLSRAVNENKRKDVQLVRSEAVYRDILVDEGVGGLVGL
jgi:hypothetical protein